MSYQINPSEIQSYKDAVTLGNGYWEFAPGAYLCLAPKEGEAFEKWQEGCDEPEVVFLHGYFVHTNDGVVSRDNLSDDEICELLDEHFEETKKQSMTIKSPSSSR